MTSGSTLFYYDMSGHTQYSWTIGNNQMVGVCGGGGSPYRLASPTAHTHLQYSSDCSLSVCLWLTL